VRAVIESQLEAAGGDMLQASALAPPLLYNDKAKIGEGARAQTPWLHSFLRDPSTPIRPWLQIRMPSFDLAEDQLNTITHYFAAQDRVPYPYDPKPALEPSMVAAGKDLFGRWQCVKCHVVAGKLPNQEPANMAPDLAKVPERLRADWLALWLADPGRIMPGTRMPSNFPADPQENAYPEVLGGDQKKQIEAVRAYLLTLGKGSAAGAGTVATSR
jgi:mono/diheme cytochrome c family protein